MALIFRCVVEEGEAISAVAVAAVILFLLFGFIPMV